MVLRDHRYRYRYRCQRLGPTPQLARHTTGISGCVSEESSSTASG